MHRRFGRSTVTSADYSCQMSAMIAIGARMSRLQMLWLAGMLRDMRRLDRTWRKTPAHIHVDQGLLSRLTVQQCLFVTDLRTLSQLIAHNRDDMCKGSDTR